MDAPVEPGGERILVVDDERSQREILQLILEGEGYRLATAANGALALQALREAEFDLVLTDLKMPGMSGIALLEELLRTAPGACVVLMTAHGSIGTAVDAIKKGAYDYLTKPLDRDQLFIVLRRALDRVRLVRENQELRQDLRDRFRLEHVIGESGSMHDVLRVVGRVAPAHTTVLLHGEAGTGKELVARALHYGSDRAARPFYALNLTSIPPAAQLEELFGVAGGTGEGRPGLVERASGSTLFLDGVSALVPDAQLGLLRVLVAREVVRTGGGEAVPVDVRVVAATHDDLQRAVADGRFRDDLFHRLSVVALALPALRQRRTDIPSLVEHFLKKHSDAARPRSVSDDALKALMAYHWPGNVRELESVIERAVALANDEMIGPRDLPIHVRAGLQAAPPLLALEIPDEGIDLPAVERALVLRALEKADGNLARAARLLGVTRHELEARIERHQPAAGS
jgi:DNA-binding NtrC family response regulator